MSRLIALVGLPGAGKSTVTDTFTRHGFALVYFGALTLEKVAELRLEPGEASEKKVREQLRVEHGMAAYATLNIPKIKAGLLKSDVIIDGLYSWEEYRVLRDEFPELKVVAVYAPPLVRYERLAKRKNRPLTTDEARSRDISQIENLHQAGPIAMADWTFINTGSTKELILAVEEYLNDATKSRTN